MKKSMKFIVIIAVISVLFGLSSCSGKSASEYKSVMSAHMRNIHGVSINSYEEFNIHESGNASASVKGTAQTADLGGTIEMSAQLTVDADGHLFSCSWCDLGIG